MENKYQQGLLIIFDFLKLRSIPLFSKQLMSIYFSFRMQVTKFVGSTNENE